jgi:hypothetical protein
LSQFTGQTSIGLLIDEAPNELALRNPAWSPRYRSKYRDRAPVHGDDDALACLNAPQQSARVIPQLARGYLGHATIVAHVRLSQTIDLDLKLAVGLTQALVPADQRLVFG